MRIFIRLTFIILFVFPSFSCFSHLVWYHYLCHFNNHPPSPLCCIGFQTQYKSKSTAKHTENCHSSPRTPQAKEHSVKKQAPYGACLLLSVPPSQQSVLLSPKGGGLGKWELLPYLLSLYVYAHMHTLKPECML